MTKLFNLATLFLLIALFAMPFVALAQDSEVPPLPEWTNFLPAALVALVLTNYRVTDWFKRILASPNLGYTPPKDIASVIVLAFSGLFGIFLAWITPHATDWLAPMDLHPALAIAFTGLSTSALGGIVHEIAKRLGVSAIYETKTTISAPPSDTPPATANKALDVAAQAVKAQG